MNSSHDLGWLAVVAHARNTDAETWDEADVTVRRISGGANNALYQARVDGQTFACKLCVADTRLRAHREYTTLNLLQRAQPDLAPQPIAIDESYSLFEFPIVVYRWLDGIPLAPPLTQVQIGDLLDSLQKLHAVRHADFSDASVLDAFFHFFNFDWYLQELQKFHADYSEWLATYEPDGHDWAKRIKHLLDLCGASVNQSSVNPSREQFSRCLVRVDPNLANTVWRAEQPLRWIDWEYSGWGDPALDLSDFRWHIALDELSESQHTYLREHYRRPDHDPQFDARLALWDSILVVRWCMLIVRLLWSAYHGPDRVRLTTATVSPTEARRRLLRMIERAEKYYRIG